MRLPAPVTQRQQEREIDPWPDLAALADPGDDAVDPLADGGRDLQARVQLGQVLESALSYSASFGKSSMKRRISLTSGVSVRARNSTMSTTVAM